jgi:hypothetical protein
VPSTWLIRRAVWESVGDFDPARRIGEDLQWLSRAKDAGIVLAMPEDVLVHKRAHEANLTSNITGTGADAWLYTLRESLNRRRMAQKP